MQIRLYGLIAEKAGVSSLQLEAPDTTALLELLRTRIPDLDSLSYALAVDRKIVNEQVLLNGDEEIALLPPFAGG